MKILRSLRALGVKELTALTILLFTAPALAGCSAAPAEKQARSVATPAKNEATGVVFPRTADDVQKAAANALVMTGFEITKEEPLYVEGARRALGVLPAETVGVRLESLGPARTRIRIETAKALVGIGQKDWQAPVLEEMEKALGKRE